MNIKKAAHIIKTGGLVAFPTETVYGLGANAFNDVAVKKIFQVKNRPNFDPLIVHIYSIQQLNELVVSFPEKAQQLAEKFWPGPLTLVLKKKKTIPNIVTSGLNTVAIRIPNHPIALQFLKEVHLPIAAPSANPFGYISPTTAQHVKKQIGNQIDMILDGGICKVGLESTIIDFSSQIPKILRWGGLPLEKIESIIGKVIDQTSTNAHPSAPGQLKSHYAPHKPLILFSPSDTILIDKMKKKYKIGFLLSKPNNFLMNEISIILSKNGDLQEVAHNLFIGLHKLDEEDIDIILAEKIEENGLGKSIMDRLYKAQNKRNKE